jgi:hypothetical protein
VIVVGNSVVSHTSRCDASRKTLADLTGAALERPLLNLGSPGQSFSEALNYVAIALRKTTFDAAVVFLAPYQLSEWSWPSLQTQLFLTVAAPPELTLNSLSARIADGYLLGGRDVAPESFRYKGVDYPDYEGLKSYFAIEKTRMSCPESLGQQRQFIEAYYWYQYGSRPPLASNIEDLRRLSEEAKRRDKQLLVVMLPADLEDVAALNPELARSLSARLHDAVVKLRAHDLWLLDLSDAAPATFFADRWCACGHLAEPGRRFVAERTAAELKRVLAHK